MRSAPLLTIGLVLALALAGCASKSSTPPPQNTLPPTSEAPPPSSQAPPPTSQAPPPPPDPKVLPQIKLNFADTVPGPEEQSVTFDAGVTRAVAHVEIWCTTALSTLQAEAGQSAPDVLLKPPQGGTEKKVGLEQIGPADLDSSCPHKHAKSPADVTFPAVPGSWKVQIHGTGNVEARVTLTLHFD